MTPPNDSPAESTGKRLEVPRPLVEFILLGPEDDRRQLQDSPILGDVWIEFARRPGERLELLITPYKEQAAGTVASVLTGDRLIKDGVVVDVLDRATDAIAPDTSVLGEANVAFLQGIVAASLTFDEVLRHVVPMTSWWGDKHIARGIEDYIDKPVEMVTEIDGIFAAAKQWFTDDPDKDRSEVMMQERETRKRYIALAGLILWAQGQPAEAADARADSTLQKVQRVLEKVNGQQITVALQAVFKELGPKPKDPLVWTISLNRRALPAIMRSVPAVKADAARTLFTVDSSEIVWAVIDAGIDASHPAFLDNADEEKKASRVKRSFDFTRIRDIVSLDNLRPSPRRTARVAALRARNLKHKIEDEADATEHLRRLARGAKEGRSVNWELVEPFVELDPMATTNVPRTHHGTHVAGIIGASKRGARAKKPDADVKPPDAAVKSGGDDDESDAADGMCPEIRLWDFRVLGGSIRDTEFAIIAACQYIRYINERNSYITVHGANLSLSIPHDVRNYACGRTPVCNECERLVNSGVVVVAAAGNRGYQNFETKEGIYESYAAFSVTDPGNADGVITVGATHRFWPHTYGVSFFSSRGPTGDGRVKPDLVAPGERIRAPLPGGEWGDLDGTSMAAPHVSGAAAMLMARYTELIGQPRRIKDILCRSATDLGREKTFQGHGMVDVLRAFQSI
jgi:serine protease AprX